jgi:hypothetical protein
MAIYHLRHGARLLRRSPIFTVVALASLGVGLASAVRLFTAMNAMLFRLLLGDSAANILVAQERCRLFSRWS